MARRSARSSLRRKSAASPLVTASRAASLDSSGKSSAPMRKVTRSPRPMKSSAASSASTIVSETCTRFTG
ncbi:MAG: hypothetical protein QM765_08460 [Myxococcales bacterium]